MADFTLGPILGTGSFGRVSLAKHNITGVMCAVKALSKAHVVKNQQVHRASLTEPMEGSDRGGESHRAVGRESNMGCQTGHDSGIEFRAGTMSIHAQSMMQISWDPPRMILRVEQTRSTLSPVG